MNYQLRKRNKKNIPYTFFPVDSEDEFQKAESSSYSRHSKRTAALLHDIKQREMTECNSIQRPFNQHIYFHTPKVSKGPSLKKSIFPLGNPPIWDAQCQNCLIETDKIAKKFEQKKIFQNEIDNIYLITGDQSKSHYIVEYVDNRLEKHTTQSLIKQHLKQFVWFLEKAALQKKK